MVPSWKFQPTNYTYTEDCQKCLNICSWFLHLNQLSARKVRSGDRRIQSPSIANQAPPHQKFTSAKQPSSQTPLSGPMKEILLKIEEKSTDTKSFHYQLAQPHQKFTSAKQPSSYPLLSKHKHFVNGKYSYCWLSFLLVVFMSLEESLRVVKIGILRAKCRILGAKSGYSSFSLQSWVPG